MKALFLTSLCFCLIRIGVSQNLLRASLTKEDSLNGVLHKFEYNEVGSYGEIRLILMKNNTYLYSKKSFAHNVVSEGKWKLKNNRIILNSTIQKNDVPIKIDYGKEGDFVDSLRIAVVKNIKNEPMTDAFVLVNNDSTKCLPLIGDCNRSISSIYQVKVVFENGMCSKWIPVEQNETGILITVLTTMPISNYMVLNNKSYKNVGNLLKTQ